MKLRLLFYTALFLLVATEIYRTYLLMPMPGSQLEPAVDISYPLYSYRWVIRIVLLVLMAIGFRKSFENRKWIPVVSLLISGIAVYMANVKMTAENMFYQPKTLQFVVPADADLSMDALIIGVTAGTESRAYPIRFLTFHHQVNDIVGGQNVLVTYCSVCRSGIVFNPVREGWKENFRLVGMDQFNAMFEDEKTGSWWMQATGECVAGECKGQKLAVIPSEQMTLGEWIQRHPEGKVMLPDPEYTDRYDDEKFEQGTTTSSLEYTDTASWHDKSWVIGVENNGSYRAYDWNQLKRERAIHDSLGGEEIMLTIDEANVNYEVVIYYGEDPDADSSDMNFHPGKSVQPKYARQTFWHTWKTFYPTTSKYPE